MADVAELELKVSGRTANREIDSVDRNLQQLGRTADKTGTRMQKGFTAVGSSLGQMKVVIGSLVGAMAIRGAIKTFAEFQQQIAGIKAVTQATDAEMQIMTRTARQLGATTQFSATQAAQAMQFMAMAGFNTGQIIGAIPGVLDLAASDMIDLGVAADMTTGILAGFGLEASRATEVADALAVGASATNTSVTGIGEAMKFVGPVARTLNISLNEAAAAVGVLSNANIKGGEAGTSLRRVMIALINPTKESEKVLRSYGLTVEDVNPQIHGFTGVLQKLAEAEITAADAAQIFDSRGVTGFLALSKNIPLIKDLTNQLNNSAGAAKRMAETRMDTLIGDWLKFKSAVQEVIIATGEDGLGGALRNMVQSSTQAVGWLNTNWKSLAAAGVATWLTVEDAADKVITNMVTFFDRGSSYIGAGWLDLKSLFYTIMAAIEEAWGKMMQGLITALKKLIDVAAKAASAIPGAGDLATNLQSASARMGSAAGVMGQPSSLRGAAAENQLAASQLQDEAEGRMAARNQALAERSMDRMQTKGVAVGDLDALKETNAELDKTVKTTQDAELELNKLGNNNAFDKLSKGIGSFVDGYERALNQMGDFNQRMSDMGEGIANSIDQNLTDALTDFVMGTKTAKEAFREFASAMIADLIRIMIQQLIVRSLMSALGGLGGGGGAPVMHEGGVVGAGGPSRPASAGMFTGARKFAGGGVAGDEVPVIAHRGEGIFTEEQMAALGQAINGGDRDRKVEIINVADPQMVDERIAANPNAVLNVINSNRSAIRRIIGVQG